MANYMKEVAQILGVELGEEFQLEDLPDEWFLIDKELGLMCTENGVEVSMEKILLGCHKIAKQPWSPKRDREFWSYTGNDFFVTKASWNEQPWEYALLKCGMVFRTKEEAIAARPHIYTELTGKEWKERKCHSVI